MTIFQIGALILLAGMFVFTGVIGLRAATPRLVIFIWCSIWAAAAVAIAWPQATVVVANRLGIQRGADLVFYCGLIAMFAGFFAVYIRLKKLESAMTRIVRELALRAPAPPPAEVSAGSERSGRDASPAAQA